MWRLRSPLSVLISALPLLTLPSAAESPQDLRFEIKVGAVGESNLAPELDVAIRANAVYVGMNILKGHAVLALPPDIDKEEGRRLLKSMPEVTEVYEVDREHFSAVTSLIVILKDEVIIPSTEFMGMVIKRRYTRGRYIVTKPEHGLSAELFKSLKESDQLRFVEPNYRMPRRQFVYDGFHRSFGVNATCTDTTIGRSPQDAYYKSGSLWGLEAIHAEEAWKTISTAPDVVVAVIDSGIDYCHEDLADNMWNGPGGRHGTNLVETNRPDKPMDKHGHGTWCAGIIGAVGDSPGGTGLVGVAWKTQLMAIRAIPEKVDPDSVDPEIDPLAEAIRIAVDDGARIINTSWGFSDDSKVVEEAVQYADCKNVLIVASAGNNQSDNDSYDWFPSTYKNENIISVAAVDCTLSLRHDSSYGAENVDLAAPGEEIWSTDLHCEDVYVSNPGTSMAAPFVAGAAALTLQKCPTLKPSEVRKLIMDNVRPLKDLKGKMKSGGLLCLDYLKRDCDAPAELCK